MFASELSRSISFPLLKAICLLALCFAFSPVTIARSETLQFQIKSESGKLLPCRIHLKEASGKPIQAPGLPFWRDHFACAGTVELDVPAGAYHYEIERGPEYAPVIGDLEIKGPETKISKTLKRICNLRSQGWYSGDLHVHRSIDDVPLLMQAEDLDFAPTITWWNERNPWKENTLPPDVERTFDSNRHYTIMAGEDEREGGALLYFGLKRPLDLTAQSREFPSPMKFVLEAHQQNPDVWIDVEKPFWWDVPVWLASGQMDSIGLANNHMCRSQMYENEAWGFPRDVQRLPNPTGNGMWTQEIYYHILNCGIRIPPSAGSASGVLPNPVGYNRVYAHLDQPFTSQNWFEAVRRGNTFVTNGPLLIVKVNNTFPGSTFSLKADGKLALTFDAQLITNDFVPKLEVIYNGDVVKSINCQNVTEQRLQFDVEIDQPGWFLIRAITDVQHTFRFASTAPWYVESEDVKSPVKKDSAEFFLELAKQRADRVRTNLTDPGQLRSVIEPHEAAIVFWTNRVHSATHE